MFVSGALPWSFQRPQLANVGSHHSRGPHRIAGPRAPRPHDPPLPGTYVPRTYVPRYLCSPVPMFPGTDVPRTYVPRYLCSPVPMFPEPMFPGTYVPDLLQMCCRAYVRRPSDRHWNCRAAKRKNVTQNVTN